MVNFEHIKAIVESEGSMKFSETDGTLVIMKEDVAKKTNEIGDLLNTFGIGKEDVKITPEGTEINCTKMSANKFQLLLSPFIEMSNMVVKDSYTLLILGLFVGLTEAKEDSEEAETPEEEAAEEAEEDSCEDLQPGEEVVGVQESLEKQKIIAEALGMDVNSEEFKSKYAALTETKKCLEDVNSLATFLDESLDLEIKIVDDSLVETNFTEEIMDFLTENEAQFDAFDVTITNDKVNYKIK